MSAHSAFKAVPRTGVIYVMHRATEQGYTSGDPQWANLGQGSPETGPIPGAPPRVSAVTINPASQAYAPVDGLVPLRQAVADLYNRFYREGKASQYSYENVSICGGGRTALTRLAAALSDVNMGHFLPDYTAYEELLSTFRTFVPIPLPLQAAAGYRISPEALREAILSLGLNAILASNPCNPTGQVVAGDELRRWVEVARETHCTFILDEFYSHYLYMGDGGPTLVSAAAYVEDVEEDQVILVDGLTKNWRYPGWRISWTIGPRAVIERVASAGSFLDGGASNPFQAETLPLLDPELTLGETAAIQRLFQRKRDYVMGRLRAMGIQIEAEPQGAFYLWANLGALPAPLNDGMRFFEAGLKERVITVPGLFFDVNPGKRRQNARYQSYARISFGPAMETLERGMDAIERLIARYR